MCNQLSREWRKVKSFQVNPLLYPLTLEEIALHFSIMTRELSLREYHLLFPDARYASKLRNKALQIGCRPEDVSYCVRGHTITKTEIAKHQDFYYQLTTTFPSIPRATRFKTGSIQTDVELPRCSKDCHGCGRLFTCL